MILSTTVIFYVHRHIFLWWTHFLIAIYGRSSSPHSSVFSSVFSDRKKKDETMCDQQDINNEKMREISEC